MNWSVYKHTLPNGKVYIGITSLDPSQRWNNGFGYQKQHKFFKEIVLYGWDNIKHEVIATNLSEIDARKIEKEMIENEKGNSLNTQLRVGWSNPWKNISISDGDNSIRKHRFSEYADYWLDKAKYRDTVPFDWEIFPDHLRLIYYTCEQNLLYMDEFEVNIPPNITYDELYYYLTWKCDFKLAEHIKCEKLGEIDKITVDECCKSLGISRKTWYNRVAEVG